MIRMHNVELRRGRQILLQGAELTVHPGWRVGLTGANGSGKSSLLAALQGELSLDAGSIEQPDDWVVAHLPQEVPGSARPAVEYVLDGDAELRELQRRLEEEHDGDGAEQARLYARLDAIDGWTAEARARRLLAGLGFSDADGDRPMSDFSGGWRMRLGLARTLMTRSDLLLLDEPTNHLDVETIVWLEGWLARYPGTVIVIAHDRRFLDAVVTHIAHIERGALTLYSGGYTQAEARRAEAMAQSEAAAAKVAAERAHLEQFVRRFRAKASKARQAQSRLKRLEALEDVAVIRAARPVHLHIPSPQRLPDSLLALDHATVGHGESRRLHPASLRLRPEDRVGILGPNGAGKSTLLALLAGELEPDTGERQPAPDLRIGYFAQHQREQLDLAASPLAHLQRQDPRAAEQDLRNFLGGLGFGGERADRPVGECSGGERVRLVLAQLMWQAPSLLLLDEPTNHLDLDMREALGEALEAYAGGLVVVAHDRELLARVCDRFWRVEDGHLSEFDGDLDDYARELQERRSRDEAGPEPAGPGGAAVASGDEAGGGPALSQKDRRREAARAREALKPLQQRADRAEAECARLQERLDAIEAELADGELYTGDAEAADRLAALTREQGELRRRLEDHEGEWMEAMEALEAARPDAGGSPAEK
ncbi:ABC-F family ATP-binding cassette domain-containing protein [Thioalkalivibrio sp. ALgr3]|uniref:ABC-F family ATP-binding cassette domain-containing protein n=1 Tax=Thioalkalivibrio sp. ALgr3 TaxID=1239292 RepID=UPI00037F3455|nr:ATP-binding cassette domain-containing protein [Thioalkalivibrio sp. ALgr3]